MSSRTPFVEEKRLVRVADALGNEWFDWWSERGLSFKFTVRIHDEPILITDPIYLADVYNEAKDEAATFVRVHGATAQDFGGDTSCPVWYKHPYVLLPTSGHYYDKGWDKPLHGDQEFDVPSGVAVLANEVGCDSASFVFLPLTHDLPYALRKKVAEVARDHNGAIVQLPAGLWRLYFEQWDPSPGKPIGWYRNVVLKWEESSPESGYE